MKRRNLLAACTLAACAGWMLVGLRLLQAATTSGQSRSTDSAMRFLPLFPLRLVAFPGERVLLEISEPRYRQLIEESAGSGMNFGIVTVVPDGVSSIGTEMRFDRFVRQDDSGRMDVAVLGLRVFRLKRFRRDVEGKLYPGGLVSFHRNDAEVEPEIQSAVVQLYNRIQYLSGTRRQLVAPYPDNLSFIIGHDVRLSGEQELQLLAMPAEHDRQIFLLQHLLRMQ